LLLRTQVYRYFSRKEAVDIQDKPDLETSLGQRFAVMADGDRVARTATALEANGISVVRAGNAADAKRVVLDLVPAGAQVHNGASQTLEETGIADEIHNFGRYEPIHPRIWSMDRETQADEIRRLTWSPDVMLGSVHSGVNKVLIINREYMPGRITVVFVDEALGF
jgi:hypothetical protein